MIIFSDTLDAITGLLAPDEPLCLCIRPVPTEVFKQTLLPDPAEEEIGVLWMMQEHDALLRYFFFDQSPYLIPDEDEDEANSPSLASFVRDLREEIFVAFEKGENQGIKVSTADTIVVVSNYSYPHYGDNRASVVLVVDFLPSVGRL